MPEGGPQTLAGPREALVPPEGAGLAGSGAGLLRRVPVAGLARTAALTAYLLYAWQQSSNFESVLSLAAIWGIAAVGLGLVLGAAGQISLCQASFVLVGAYVYGTIAKAESGPTLLALGASALGGAAAALLVSPVLRARGYYLALATIAVSLLTDRVVTTGGWIPGGNAGLIGVPSLKIGGLRIQGERRYLELAAILLVAIIAVLHRLYGRGAARRAIQALHHDEDLLAGFGGNAAMLKLRVFVIGGLLAGLAGGLYAGNFGYVSDNIGGPFGLQESFALALAVFIGGSGRLTGAIVGYLVYRCSFEILGFNYADYRLALLGGVVILTTHFFPRGLTPSRADFAPWLPRRRRPAAAPEVDAEHHELDPVEPLSLAVVGLKKPFGAL